MTRSAALVRGTVAAFFAATAGGLATWLLRPPRPAPRPPPDVEPARMPPSLDLAAAVEHFCALANQERETAGLPVLLVVDNLTQAAAIRAGQLAAAGTLSHTSPDDPDPLHYAYLAILRSWNAPIVRSGENAGRVPASTDAVPSLHAAWMASANHRENVLDPEFRRLGVGVAMADGWLYAVALFSREAQDAQDG